MVITTAVVGLAISHVVAILAGWWAKAKAVAKAEVTKVTPEAESILAEVKAEIAKAEAVAETDAKKVIAAIKAKL